MRARLATQGVKATKLIVAFLMAVSGQDARAQATEMGKAGRFMLNLKLGPAISLAGGDVEDHVDFTRFGRAGFTQAAVQLELGVALNRKRTAYLIFPLQAHLGNPRYVRSSSAVPGYMDDQGNWWDVTISSTEVPRYYYLLMAPVGFQYDFAIPGVPGLFLYPRFSLGLGALLISGPDTSVAFGAVFIPEFGIKYVLLQRFNFGLEPFSLTGMVGALRAGEPFGSIQYRVLGHVGVNF